MVDRGRDVGEVGRELDFDNYEMIIGEFNYTRVKLIMDTLEGMDNSENVKVVLRDIVSLNIWWENGLKEDLADGGNKMKCGVRLVHTQLGYHSWIKL